MERIASACFRERGLPVELGEVILAFASPWKEAFSSVMAELLSDSMPDIGVEGDTPYRHACNRCIYFSAAACGMLHVGVSSLSYRLYFRRRKLELLAEPPRTVTLARYAGIRIRSVDRLLDCDVWPVLYPKHVFDVLCPRVSAMYDRSNERDPLLSWERMLSCIRNPAHANRN